MDPHVEALPATTTGATEDVIATKAAEEEEVTMAIDMMDVAATMATVMTVTSALATMTVTPQAVEVTTAETTIIMTLVVKSLLFTNQSCLAEALICFITVFRVVLSYIIASKFSLSGSSRHTVHWK